MTNYFLEKLERNLNIDLNEQQKQAIIHKNGPAIVLAVPGAGKTTVLICRTANLIFNHNISPNSILSLTFSKASAKDMRTRFNSFFGVNYNINFSTIHSFAFKLIREYSYYNKLNYTLIEGFSSKYNKITIIKQFYQDINKKYIAEDKLEELLNTIGYVKNMMIPYREFSLYDNFDIDSFDEIFMKYENYKKRLNLLDFDDLLSLTLDILQNNPDVLRKYQSRYKYIQIDEGQDTSKIQNAIITLLTQPNNNLFVVADDDQSIYSFRGAFPQALLTFGERYQNSKTFFMEENYRSSKNIVSICDDFIKSNVTRYKKTLNTNNSAGEPIKIVKMKDEYEQLNYIINKLNNTSNFSDNAILYRNNISAIPLIDRLQKENIPFYVRDMKVHFFKHWIVNDIICFLKLISDNGDIESFEQIYYKMKGYTSKVMIQFVKMQKPSKSVFTILTKYPGLKFFQKDNIVKLQMDFKLASHKKPFSIINYIETKLEYDKYLQNNCKKFGYSYENSKIILSILKMIAKETTSIEGFFVRLDELQNIIKNSKDNKKSNSVVLSTLHSSKGLEFENVYLVDLIDGDFPSTSSIKSFENGHIEVLEEERRLFYVGMTRAKENLTLLTPKLRNDQFVLQSRFIDELEQITQIPSQKVQNFNKKFIKGKTIIHAKFGEGTIMSIKSNVITIHFKTEGIKKFSFDFCVENNIIW